MSNPESSSTSSGERFGEWSRRVNQGRGRDTLRGHNVIRTADTMEKAANSRGWLNFFAGVVATAAVAVVGFGALHNANATPAPEPAQPRTETVAEPISEAAPASEQADTTEFDIRFAGETVHGTRYNYTEYADYDNKVTHNAYGYDQSEAFGDRDKTIDGIMEKATTEPEALASYAYNIFTDAEKETLGIKGLSMTEIDNKMDEAGGGDLQKQMLTDLETILRSDQTELEWYYENNVEKTNYIYFIDADNDGAYAPEELHLGYSTKQRNHAPQVDIFRYLDTSGDQGLFRKVKMLDLNMQCGYQPNYGVAPTGVPEIPDDEPVKEAPTVQGQGGGEIVKTTPKPKPQPKPQPKPTPPPVPPTPTPPPQPPAPTPEWGKEGDPHGDELVTPSDLVDPGADVTAEENAATNEDKQGYVDDNQATPGSSSDWNGINPDTGFAASGIIAEGAATEGGRLEGGENQAADENGNAEMAGDNTYHDETKEAEGQKVDDASNDVQAEAHKNEGGGSSNSNSGDSSSSSSDSGGNADTHSDSEEESRVASGEF